MELEAARTLKMKKLKKVMLMLAIAIIVLFIEKLSEFLSAIMFYGTASAYFGVNSKTYECTCPENNISQARR